MNDESEQSQTRQGDVKPTATANAPSLPLQKGHERDIARAVRAFAACRSPRTGGRYRRPPNRSTRGALGIRPRIHARPAGRAGRRLRPQSRHAHAARCAEGIGPLDRGDRPRHRRSISATGRCRPASHRCHTERTGDRRAADPDDTSYPGFAPAARLRAQGSIYGDAARRRGSAERSGRCLAF